jgi:ribosomal protein S18 acetylase RimI-like enzyme
MSETPKSDPNSTPFRPITRFDAIEIGRILDAVHALSLEPIGSKWTAQQIADECGKGGVASCLQNGQIASFILFQTRVEAWEIELLATAPDARGQGRMSGLIQYLLGLVPANTEIWLEVHEANSTARRLYAKMGFKEIGRRPSYYADGGAAILYNYG